MSRHLPFVLTPAMKLLVVVAVAVTLQSDVGLLVGLLIIAYVLHTHRERFLLLLRRVRLLILVLFAVTLLMTPGTALFPQWGLYPTIEGVSLALVQLIRLLGMLSVVCWLLDTTDDRSLAAGCLALLQPLAGQRQWPERTVARLLLVFHYLEAAPKPRDLKDLLTLAGQEAVTPLPDAPQSITLRSATLTRPDLWFGLGVFGLAGLTLFAGDLL